ncbi:MAG: gluconate 2-dehydrogenase subunit 3 family protein [Gammaproteobacteria bacterium]
MSDRIDAEVGASPYQNRLTRRESLRRMAVLAAGAVPIAVWSASAEAADGSTVAGTFAPWPSLDLKAVNAAGYGTDPDLITPVSAPWPRLLSEAQRSLGAVLADIIVPREDDVPAASEVGAVDVLDEWISAPYPSQQADRQLIEPGLRWIDDEAQRRHGEPFVRLSKTQRLAIVDEIAFTDQPTPAGLEMPKAFFARLRALVVGAFLTSPEGTEDLGYVGNVPIRGDYPGPTPEAMAHLEKLLDELGLSQG